jgi:hypothetical protein
MDIIRDAIVRHLRDRFPDMESSIMPFIGLLDEQTEKQISYRAPGILIGILPFGEVPDAVAPWEMAGEFGAVISVAQASAIERDKAGWTLSMRVAQAIYRNTWGFPRMEVCPAIITNIQKNVQLDSTGSPTGVNYWTIQFHNWLMFEALVK